MLRRYQQSQVQYNDCETIKLCGRKIQTHLQGVFGRNENSQMHARSYKIG